MDRHETSFTREGLLAGTGVFAALWIFARARLQSITIDEADTYLMYVGTPSPSHWIPASNNHVLNSALMRLSSTLFGVSNLSLRLPALMGALIYIVSAYVLVRLMTRAMLLSWALFACLVLNPMVMDYLVAARGYSLALAFLMAAITVVARGQMRGSDTRQSCAMASVLVGLSFSANFSFALVDAVVIAGLAWWCLPEKFVPRLYARIAAAAIAPGLAVALYLVGPVVATWPKNELHWGATTFKWSMQSISEQCFSRLSHFLVDQPYYDFLIRHRHWLLPLLALALLGRLGVFLRERKEPQDEHTRWLAQLALVCCAGAVLTIALHGILVAATHLLWPRGRTGLFLPPLLILSAGALAAVASRSKVARYLQTAATVLLAAIACYFILCLRLTWFTEWFWNANSDRLYSIVAYYNRAYGVQSIGTNWRYVAVLNYYRTISGHETLDPVRLEHPIPADRPLYVLFPEDDRDFAKREGLKIVYHDEVSDAWVAIRPELENRHP